MRAMTKKISSISAFKGLKTPTIESGDGLIPDLHSRYFTADFAYGLKVIKQIGDFAGVQTPVIDDMMSWYRSICLIRDEFDYADYGIFDRKTLEDFYLI